MKKIIILFGLLNNLIVNAQTYKGTVVDCSNKPLPYANVVLYTLPDSTFVVGTITNNDGDYMFSSVKGGALKISSVGFETVILDAKADLGVVVLQSVDNELGEVVVKGVQKIYKMEGGALMATIKNSIFSKLGTANDVLAQLPFVVGEEGGFKVLGRGSPIIYINNRKVQDANELSQLKSNQIKDIKVNLNPGAEYDASTSSVIKITSYRVEGNGVSGQVYSFLKQKRDFNHYKSVSLNYRRGGLDIFFYGNHNRSKTKQNQKGISSFIYNDEILKVSKNTRLNYQDNYYNLQSGFNYIFNEKHMIGVKYNYKKEQNSPVSNSGMQDAYLNGISYKNSLLKYKEFRDGERQYVNTYYDGKIGEQMVVHFDGDYISGKNKNYKQTLSTSITDGTTEEVLSKGSSDYLLYAGKLWMKTPFLGGDFLLGSEVSYTENNQKFKMLNQVITQDIPSSIDQSEQLNIAPFATFSKEWNNMSLNIGFRYEYVKFDYFLNTIKQREQSKIYNDIFPTLSLAYNTDNYSMSLSYRNSIQRPSYYQLRSSITYNDPFTYEGGNPALHSANIHNFNYSASYKKMMFDLVYRHISDYVLFGVRQFEDEPALLFKTENHKIVTYSAHISYSPTISFWKPTLSFGISGQNLTYLGNKYNKPNFEYSLKNIFNLPKEFVAILNITGSSYGSQDLSTVKPNFRTDFSIRKQFWNKKWSALIGISDIFDTSRERWTMKVEEIYVKKWNDRDSHSVYFRLSYKFNTATKNRYKGQKSTTEINRL